MKKKLLGIFVCMLLIAIVVSAAVVGNELDLTGDSRQMRETLVLETIHETGFENGDEWESGSVSGPDLWHTTSVDSYSGDYALGCFDKNTRHYVNNMNFNYLIFNPTFSIAGAIEMKMEYFCKYITEDSDDFWGIALYDTSTDRFIGFGHLYGYHAIWMYQTFDIKSAYDYCYQMGYFRNSDGSRSYDFRIGFVFIKTDSSGVTNAEAEAHGDYWSGLFVDDISIKRLIINNSPHTPSTPSGPGSGTVGTSYEYTTRTTDPDGHQVKYGWDWNGDGTVDEWSGLMNSGSTDSRSHTWTTAGTYNVKVKAEDSLGAQSDFSSAKTVVISANNPPDKPTCEYDRASDELVVSATDPDGDKVRYGVSWDNDGNVDVWTELRDSGEEVRINCEKRSGTVGVIAEDEYGAQSEWVSVKAKNKPYINPLFLRFLENHPLIYQLLQRFLKL